ncbi:hypothetical protein [Staphylococcus phage vB_SauM-V1SA09]|nr:hypothetical protein [Staphylococcus phage vB_ScaM-V1SC01]WOZ17302.1 hypothetical protein [Staphylococcus phage vB_SauM-V1SA09]WPF67579.1 hypothetical protein [Staphylococcus phage vB_SauM-V1SA12]
MHICLIPISFLLAWYMYNRHCHRSVYLLISS